MIAPQTFSLFADARNTYLSSWTANVRNASCSFTTEVTLPYVENLIHCLLMDLFLRAIQINGKLFGSYLRD